MLVLIERCQNTETHSSLHMGLHGCREHLVSGCTMESRRAGRGRVIIWAMLCWETFGPAIHVDVMLTCTTYLSIIADHVHLFMETVLSDSCGLFQQANAFCH